MSNDEIDFLSKVFTIMILRLNPNLVYFVKDIFLIKVKVRFLKFDNGSVV
jgi:hypothetical protein